VTVVNSILLAVLS